MKQKNRTITLVPLEEHEKGKFIDNIQAAFKKAVIEEFGDSSGEVITKEEVERSFNAKGAESYNIICNGQIVGGAVVEIHPETNRNALSLLFVNVNKHSQGIGLAAWRSIEQHYPETEIWETCTPYFEKRNIHFYVNRCGFHITEFINPYHTDPDFCKEETGEDGYGMAYFFHFEKKMK